MTSINFIKISYLIPLLPLAGAAVNGLISFAGFKCRKWVVSFVACGAILLAFLAACGLFFQIADLEPALRTVTVTWFNWLDLSLLKADAAFLIDPLSVTMALVVTGVSFLIHVYSTAYMAGDPSYARFFSYLNLFCFAMLVLVLADNLLLMFVGWEGVGLCSYLLIGFWFEHEPNVAAGMKAFVVNRIGDFGFLIGILILFWALADAGHGTVAFAEIRERASLLSGPVVTAVCIFLFVGACGKSAQIPLYVWLPDAMAGPTPVSALIHAATMVTAGVYMVGRMGFLYSMSPDALLVVSTVGAVTAVFSAVIGFAQDDIKKILAYSTVSQLGFMFLAMGTSFYSAGIFHLVTHAFFKACLFLGAGSVILAMHHEQRITKMGGLKGYMPVTFWTFFAATLALCGIWPFSGFYSKDEILWQVFLRGEVNGFYYLLFAMGLLGALFTAFYMFRLVSLAFFGKPRDQSAHPKEQPLGITSVLIALAVLSLVGGYVGVPHSVGKFVGLSNLLEQWLQPVFDSRHFAAGNGETAEYFLMAISLVVAFTGISLAIWLYTRRSDIVEKFTKRFESLYKTVLNKFYVDEIYHAVFVKSLLRFNEFLEKFDQAVIDGLVNAAAKVSVFFSAAHGWFDWFFVDGAVNVVADTTIASGRGLRKIQTGKIQHYFYIILVGLIALLAWRVL